MRILVADKDSETRLLISTRLTARHYEVLESTDSEEVLQTLEKETIDLAIISSEMELIKGKRLIEVIRKRSHLTAIPIVLLTGENEISEMLMSHHHGFDDFLTKPFDPLALQLRVAMNISRTRNRVEANALTHLPGNFAIERIIRSKIESREKFSVIYIDINNFKSFNDKYSFEKGDDVIRHTAKLLARAGEEAVKDRECFVGHIGGDDFIVVVHPDDEENFARKFIEEFDQVMPTYYSEEDRKRKSIRITNRRGKRETFPLMSCSVSACNNLHKDYRSLGEIARDAAEVKSFLKSQPGSHYLRDRRSSPIRVAEEAMQVLAPEVELPKASERVNPIGQVLLDAGLITEEQLQLALKKHLETGSRLGQVLISMNAVTSQDVGRMLEKRLNVPYVSLRDFVPSRDTLRLFTIDFVKAHRAVPLELVRESLKLGMCDPFDLKTLDAIERTTHLKPIPCLILEDEFEEFFDHYLGSSAKEKEAKTGS